MLTRKDNLPVLRVGSRLLTETVDREKRTVEMVIATDKKVNSYSYKIGPFWEVLDLNPSSVRLERANKGGPALDSHSRWSVKGILGRIEKAWIADDGVRCLVRFPKLGIDPEIDVIFEKIADGIICNTSAGYRVYTYKQDPPADPRAEEDMPTYRAIDWELLEASFVAVGADDDSGVRSDVENKINLIECNFINEKNEGEQDMLKRNLLKRDKAGEGGNGGGGPNVIHNQAPAAPTAADIAAIQKAERERADGIRQSVRALSLDESFADNLVTNGTSLEVARGLAIDEAKKKNPNNISAQNGGATSTDIQVGKDQKREAAMSGIQNVLERRFDPSVKIIEQAQQFQGFMLRELARECLRAGGLPIHGNALEMVGRAMHQTSDFPNLFANVINKRLLDQYARQQRTWQPLVIERDLSDFKTVNVGSVGDFPALLQVNEGAEIEEGTFSEGNESYKLLTFARIISVSRQMIINDDIGAIIRVIDGIARAGSNKLSDLVWSIYKNGHSTVLMSDAKALFHADHANIAVSNAAVSTGLASMRQFLKKQTSLDGEFLDLMPKYLITGVERDDEVEKAQSIRIVPAQASNDNTFASKLVHISDPRLDAAPYFLQAEGAPAVEVGYLEGTGRGIYTESRLGFNVDGMQVKARLDCNAKAVDYRTVVRSAGT